MKEKILAATILVAMTAGTVVVAQTPPPSTGAAGETSDRTPEKKTETPLPQRDKTTTEPAGSTTGSPKGTTSDRTPDHSSSGTESPTGTDANTKGKTTTGEGATTPPAGHQSK